MDMYICLIIKLCLFWFNANGTPSTKHIPTDSGLLYAALNFDKEHILKF